MTVAERYTIATRPLQQTEAAPVRTRLTEDGARFVDFGKAAFGTLVVPLTNAMRPGRLVVHLGEQATPEGRVERSPPGSIRYRRIEQETRRDEARARIVIPPDPRNTGPAAIRMPPGIGEVLPFRYAEIEDGKDLDPAAVRQVRVHYPFDDGAASFRSDNDVLNAVWELCKYSIKATSFCGVYVDGDRERIPYEGDAYINQLAHYGVDREYALARYTHEYLLQHPTWPTEWHLHSVMMAWADFMYTGETVSLREFYEDLRVKTLVDLAREDGLISTESERCTRAFEERLHLHGDASIFRHGLRDLVDWPPGSLADGGTGERDGHEMRPVNTVVNAFHAHALALMSRIARVLGRTEDQAFFAERAALVKASIDRRLFDPSQGRYIDGEGARHASLHSNLFMLAFGLAPGERRDAVVRFVESRGMACSVYGAQHLLDALYRNGRDRYALELMTARHDRSWGNMIRCGTTITAEAWDLRYKKNLDWNHAWGAAPANIIPRFVLGVRPLEPGFRKVLVHPQPGGLQEIAGTVPSPHGPIAVSLATGASGKRRLVVDIPGDITARIGLRPSEEETGDVTVDGKRHAGRVENGTLFVDDIEPGTHELVYA